MKRFITPGYIVVLIFTLISLLSACTPPMPNTPMTVAQAFWTATLEGDVESAKQFLTPESRVHFKIILQSDKDFVELGEQSITTTRAEILTQLTQHRGNQAHKTAMRTILLNQGGQWLVDFDQTRDSMLGSELQSTLDHFSRTLRETIDKGMQVMGESVKEEIEEMDRAMQETLEELNQELEKQQREQQKQQQTPPPAPKTSTL